VKVLEALAGRGNFTSMTLVDLEKDTNRHGLDGALFNVSEETPHRSLNDSSLFKNLVSGGSVQVKQLYKQPYAISNRAKIWLLCNELPKTIDMSFGMFRRLIIIPFNAKFEGATADKFIHKKLFAELPGILNIMLAAYARMLARGHIADSKLVEERILKYREETDTVSTWFVTYCHKAEVESNYVLASDLYANYCSVMEVENEKPHTKAAFFKRLSRAWKEYTKYSTKLRINNVETRVVYGIKMSNESAF
jgi:putative DNA primase/helicase